jgi:AbiJ N-terminal domain 4
VRFSERYGYKAVKDAIQTESMDEDLRTGLWNILDLFVLQRVTNDYLFSHPDVQDLTFQIWHSYFKRSTDTAPEHGLDLAKELKKYLFTCEWFEVYDFFEFVVQNLATGDGFVKALNTVMERELSAFRFVGQRLAPITSTEEIAEIEKALTDSAPLAGVHTHLNTALHMLADRESPDYRNSVKESISAVEALVSLVSGRKAPLGAALKTVGVDAHPALAEAFTKLYGYTSDAHGIRHALMEEDTLEFEDAKFMLVSCAAFVNYLVAKAGRAGATL